MAQINATCIVVGRYAVIDNVRSFFHEKKKEHSATICLLNESGTVDGTCG